MLRRLLHPRGLLREQSRRWLAIPSSQEEHSQTDQNIPGQQVAEQQERNKEVSEFSELVRDFLPPAAFYKSVREICEIDFFCGVPDSLLKDFCAYVTDKSAPGEHVIAANEGAAIGLAAGHYLATSKPSLVYLQNSGFGNIINPLMSLSHRAVYRIPTLLLIGWRGEPGKRDEPQHVAQGSVTPALCAALDLPFQILPDFEEGAAEVLHAAKQHMDTRGSPYALLVKRQTFLPYKMQPITNTDHFGMTREDAVRVVTETVREKDVVVGTTGMLSRELFEQRAAVQAGHERDFLTVGSMGHAGSIALGIALTKTRRQVFCLDGDGAVLMHMGALATVGASGATNFKHIIVNNGAHDSVGGQPTVAGELDQFNFGKVCEALGYKETFLAETEDEAREMVALLRSCQGPAVLEIRVRPGSRKNLGRPTRTPMENKQDFMHFLAIGD